MRTMNTCQFIRLFCGVLFSILPVCLYANGDPVKTAGYIFSMDDVVANDESNSIDIFMSAYQESIDGELFTLVSTKQSNFEIKESISGGQFNTVPVKEISYISTNSSYAQSSIYLLIDLNLSMEKKGYFDAKKIISSLFNSNKFKESSKDKIKVIWFKEQLYPSNPIEVNDWKSFEEAERAVELSFSQNANLIASLNQFISELELSSKTEKSSIFLFTDGKSINSGMEDFETLVDQASNLDPGVRIFPIGVGETENTSFLKKIVGATPSKKDLFKKGDFSDEMVQSMVKGNNKPVENIKISIVSNQQLFGNENREYKVKYIGEDKAFSVRKSIVFNSSIDQDDIRSSDILDVNFRETLIYGIGIIGGMLLLFWGAIPLYKRFLFKRNHVKKYKNIKRKGVTTLDPLTMQQIGDEEDVVAIGDKVMLLETWKYLRENDQGATAKDHSEFFSGLVSGNFFNQRGIFQRLNWLWFGALGGFLAWGANLILSKVNFDFYMDFLRTTFDSSAKQISGALYSGTLAGLSLGFGICTMLAIVDELGQSRKFQFDRILKKSAIGILIALPVFFIESLITSTILNEYKYLGGLIGWTIFGTAIGFVSTFFSSIEKKSGLIGGFISGVLAYHLYFSMQLTPQIIDIVNASFVQMISFVFYGGLLGYILFTVVSRLEDFELVYLSPQAVHGQVKAISKWLRTSSEIDAVYIGTGADCDILVKWEDQAVNSKHAYLNYTNGEVYIAPYNESEVMVNDLIIRQPQVLFNGDRIQLGTESISLMQFNAKEKGKSDHNLEKREVAVKIEKN